MAKRALITGITGQDGSYLAELLIEKGYEIFGLVRRSSSPNISRIAHIVDRITLLQGDLTDEPSLTMALQVCQPDEIYNLAAQSFVATSWQQPVLTGDVTGLGFTRLLEAIRHVSGDARVYQASSSEMFGKVTESPQNEFTRFHPRSPYACAKVYAYHTAVNYRESYGMYIVNGILFNHESPRRGIEFVTRKITDGVARIAHGYSTELRMGNLDPERDWGHARDYVEAMWLMMQQEEPDDYVVGTGETHSVREFIEVAFGEAGLDWREHVVTDEAFLRPAEVNHLRADARKARQKLEWAPKVGFRDLVSEMVHADLERLDPRRHENGPASVGESRRGR
jgi:GDPmannose 4,6-dehydratase